MTDSTSSSNQFWLAPPISTSTKTPSTIESIRNNLSNFPSPPLRVSRVSQLDATLLDNELESILGGPIWKALELLKVQGRSYEPEMMALLRLAVLQMSLNERGATYGSTLQNLKYRNEWNHSNLQSTAVDSQLLPIQKIAYMSFQILPSYLHTKALNLMLSSAWSDESLPSSWFSLFDLRRLNKKRRRRKGEEDEKWGREWKRVVWELMSLGEKLMALGKLINFLVFLYDGRYRTLVDRILGMRLIYAQRSVNRNVSFEFLNRQLVWEAFTEFLLFIMPLINLHRLRLRLSRLLLSSTSNSKFLRSILSSLPLPILKALKLPTRQILPPPPTTISINPIDPNKPLVRPQGVLHFLPSTCCPICYSNSTSSPISLTSSDPTNLPSTTTTTTTTTSTSSNEMRVKVPYITNCGWNCRYCYYDIVGKLVQSEEEGELSWTCLRCGGEVTAVERECVKGEVIEEEEGEEEGSREGEGEEEEEEEDREGCESEVEGSEIGSIESVGSQQDQWR